MKKTNLAKLRPFPFPNAKDPKEMSRAEAIDEFNEFILIVPSVTAYAHTIIQSDASRQGTSCISLIDSAGEWLVHSGELRKAKNSIDPRFKLGDPGNDLSVPTMSACCYIAMIFAECLIREIPDIHWELATEKKQDIDYHRPVLRRAGSKAQLDPIPIVLNFARGRLRGEGSERKLSEIWLIWKEGFEDIASSSL